MRDRRVKVKSFTYKRSCRIPIVVKKELNVSCALIIDHWNEKKKNVASTAIQYDIVSLLVNKSLLSCPRGLFECSPAVRKQQQCPQLQLEPVGSNTVNKRMSTSWGMTQPLCSVENEWHENLHNGFHDISTPTGAGFVEWIVSLPKTAAGFCHQQKQASERQEEKMVKHKNVNRW